MRKNINLPKSGMGIEEGTMTKWRKAVGDAVVEGEVLVEIETEKAAQEVCAPASGTLVEILVAEGVTAPINTSLGTIET